MKDHFRTTFLFLILSILVGHTNAQRRMENLGRGVVAVRTGTSSAFISWRLLGNDPYGIGFNLYRSTAGGTAVKLNSSVLTGGTNFTDNTADLTQDNAYFVKPVLNGTEQAASGSFTLTANQAIEPCVVVPLRSGNQIHMVWVGDLDGDGEYDFIVDRLDFTNGGCKLEAYKRDGTFLWVVDMGPNSKNMDNISPGSSTIDVGNWDGVTVYDMDGDGKAEVMVRTANGVVFGDGTTLTNSNDNIQFISVLNGMTGAERSRIQLPTDYLSVGPLACSLGIGYLNGITPSLVGFMKNRNADGSFNRLMCAWDFDGTAITQKWKSNLSFGTSYGPGSDGHQMRILDFDGDGKDEIGEIGFVVKGDGTLLYNMASSGIYHGDRWHVGKLDPNRPGLQGYGIQQDNIDGLIEYYYDAGNGKVLWKHTTINVGDAARGEASDIDPRYPGYEVWSFSGLYNGPSNSQLTSSATPYPNFRIWWDGDVLGENLDDTHIDKWDYTTGTTNRLTTCYHYENATASDRNAPMFYGDIFGDWREEVVYTDPTYSKLVIMTSPYPSDVRLYTLPHNPEYRNCMTVKGYLQSNMVDYYLGYGMSNPPTPPMQTAKCVWKGNASNNIWDAGLTPNWIVNGTAGNYSQNDDVMFDISGNPDTAVLLSGTLNPSSIKVISPLNYSFGGTGSISGTTGILKSGNGSLSLNTNCDYTDTTRVEQGSLYINAGLSQSPVLVSLGATIGGSGTISKSVILNKGAMVAPGAKGNVGTLSFAGGLALPSNSICIFDITDDSTGLIKPSDKIAVTGDLNVTDTMVIQINKINGKVKAGTYPLIAYSGSFNGNLSKIGISGLFGQKFALNNSGGVISLTIESARGAAKIVWNGSSDTWDLQTTPAWSLSGVPVTFVPNDSVIFDPTGSNNSLVKIVGTLNVDNISVDASANNYTFSGTGNLGGTAGLTKTGNGTLSVLTTNSFTGKTVVNGGKLEISSLADAGAQSSIGADTAKSPAHFILNNAYLKYSGTANVSTNKGLTINGTSDTIEVANPAPLMTIQGVIAGTGNLVKTGPGILNLQKSMNTYTGNTIVKGGTLSLGDQTANSYGVNTGSITLDNGTLTLYNNSSSNYFYTNLIVPTGSAGYFNNGQRCRNSGSLTGGGILAIYLPGNIDRTIFFGDWSAFTGTINITGIVGSTFRIGNSYGYANAMINLNTNVTMYNGGTGTTGGNTSPDTVKVGALSGTTGSTIKDENWVIGSNNLDATFNGLITGYSITKKGMGAWTLTGANTYTGGTTVNGGTLIVTNTTGSGTGTGTLTVNNNGALAGTGIISGPVIVVSGGTIAPGNNSIGTLTVNNNVTLQDGSNTSIEINKSASSNDILAVTGTLSLGGTLTISNPGNAFVMGDNFKIFTGTITRSSFAAIYPSTPGTGLVWDTTALRATGTIKVKGTQSITFDPLVSKTYGDTNFNLTAMTSSGLAVTYKSSNTSVAIITGNTVSIVGAGTTNITASQSGNSNYLSAPDVSQTLTVNQAVQIISFGPITTKTYGDAPFDLSATGGTSGNLITFVSSNTNVATIAGRTVTIVGAGITTITASQAGNANYFSASDISQDFSVAKANQIITFTDQLSKRVGDSPFVLTATSSSGLPVSYTSSDNNIATISGSTVTIVATGTATITASQPGNNNYNAAQDASKTLNVLSTQIGSLTDGDVTIAPNPVKDYLTISIVTLKDKTMMNIFAMNGSPVYQGQITDKETKVDMSRFAPGTYILKITFDDQVIIRKIIKE
ncbi:MAG TPA: autotransporter-associated beta strand repeat-containing protein [Bacteroidales bacterium]